MAFEQVLGVLEVRKIKTIHLFNRTMEKAVHFRQRLLDFGVEAEIMVADQVNKVVETADIVCCSTRSNDPVFDGNDLQDGTHINGVGSYLPTMREVDLLTIKKSGKIVVDDVQSAKEEAGELIYANKSGEWRFEDLYGGLSQLSMDDTIVRDSDKEITFFKSVGAAYFDLVVAKGIYQKAKQLGLGHDIEV
ncbi:hypothetical protein ABRT01_14470 [Lentibacillus sp. L22]|uniref:ornithine cyclodeaminase family protein n=1 Tax=Lentibacillus TaxID=175304 RepID=UPI003465BBAD